MPGLVPGIHVFNWRVAAKTWMAGTTLAAYGGSPGHDGAKKRQRPDETSGRQRAPEASPQNRQAATPHTVISASSVSSVSADVIPSCIVSGSQPCFFVFF